MPICVFKTDDVRRCIEHALNSSEWEMAWEDRELQPAPALLFVHDSGVYVMSNGIPRDVLNAGERNERCYTAYAETTNPAEDEDWWQNSSDLVGGDDFVEVIQIDSSWLTDCDRFDEFIIETTDTSLRAGFRKQRQPVNTR